MSFFLSKKGTVSEVPTVKKMQAMIKGCENAMETLQKGSTAAANFSAAVKALLEEYETVKAAGALVRDGLLDQEKWEARTDDDKRTVFDQLQIICDKISSLNSKGQTAGLWVFGVLVFVLITTFTVYLWMHGMQRPEITSSGQERAPVPVQVQVIEVHKHLTSMMIAAESFNKGDAAARRTFEASLRAIEQIVISFGPAASYEVQDAVGRLGGEMLAQAAQKTTIEHLAKVLTAHLASISTRYFWTGSPGKWFEIVFWSIWGAIIGVLFYAASQLSAGMFDRHDIPMMTAEIVVTPLVVIAIFFLFDFTGITAFLPAENSIYVTLGVAFIFGFAIRRTVGLLDTIKRRILPEPSTDEKT